MNNIAHYSARCEELDAEYDAVGRDLLRIKVQNNDHNINPANSYTNQLIYCCLFDAACVTLQDTLFLLQAEANEYNSSSGKMAIVIIGVHKDWIDYKSKSTRRYLWVDSDGICSDIVTDAPINFDFVHFIHFKITGEIETHRKLTDLLKDSNIKLINPAGAASDICDSKYKTFEALKTADIATAETLFFSRFSLTDPHRIAKRTGQFLYRINQIYPNRKAHLLFIQPDRGTEARGTVALQLPAGAKMKNHPLIDNICNRNENTVVRLGCGNIFYAGPRSNFEPRRVVIRVNVFENMAIESMSGYACIADSEEQNIVTISQGAQKTNIRLVLEHLVDQNGTKHNIAVNVCTELHYAGRQIYHAINDAADIGDKIILLGIDFVLEITDGKVWAIAIDVNPRPVIAHSTFTIKNKDKLGLAVLYWQSLCNSTGHA